MRVARLAAPGEIRMEEVPRPQSGKGEVLVRVEGSGVCASNLEVWSGRPWFEYPLQPGEPGHEGWGRIEAVGAGVQQLSEGDRVATLGQRSYAEYETLPRESVIRLPEALNRTPFPGEPLGCAMNIFRRSGIEAGQTVAVVGAGFLGSLLIRLATSAGARVLAISRRDFALRTAREMGAERVIALDDREEVVDAVRKETGGRLCERVIEATGHQAPLSLAAELTGVRGRLVIAGYHQDGPRAVDMQLWNWRGLDVVNAHERDPAVYREGVEAAIDAVIEGRMDPAPLLTHRLPLDRLGEALDLTAHRPDGFLKAIVTPERTSSGLP